MYGRHWLYWLRYSLSYTNVDSLIDSDASLIMFLGLRIVIALQSMCIQQTRLDKRPLLLENLDTKQCPEGHVVPDTFWFKQLICEVLRISFPKHLGSNGCFNEHAWEHQLPLGFFKYCMLFQPLHASDDIIWRINPSLWNTWHCSCHGGWSILCPFWLSVAEDSLRRSFPIDHERRWRTDCLQLQPAIHKSSL